jgi:hypothetical protein
MLFALLDEHDPAIEEQLRAANASLAGVHAEVKRALGTGECRIWEGILLTPRVRKIISLAGTRAGDRDIEPIDLFEAIRDEGGGLAAAILLRARNSASAGR